MSFEIYLVKPRGFCAGVDRAIDIVELCLEKYGTPLYVRREIVHNKAVVDRFRAKGVVFVEELNEVPNAANCVFSAHGVASSVFEDAKQRSLNVVDATCPLVTKVHTEVKRGVAAQGTVILIGHAGHDEVLGTMGQAPEKVVLVETVADVQALEFTPDTSLSYVTQTTLSVDETRDIINALRKNFPKIHGPAKDDICYATQNRQDAIKWLVNECDIDGLLVVGSHNSSNSKRLVEVALDAGVKALLVDGPEDLQRQWLERLTHVGLSAGASAPEDLVQDMVKYLQANGGVLQEKTLAEENVHFALPVELRRN